MRIERGLMGRLPYAATGAGRPVVVLAGLSPTTGVDGDGFVRGVLAPVRQLAARRRLFVLNRRPGLPDPLTMRALAAEHADALQEQFDGPVDVVGTSTGGSIAQQLAAEHPETVGRLVLVSTAARLGPLGRDLQRRVGVELRQGNTRTAAGLAAGGLVPWSVARPPARALGRRLGEKIIPTAAAVDLAVTIEAEDAFDLAQCPPIRARTLIIAGGRDRFYAPALFTETADLIADSQLRLFPKRGHITVLRDRRALATIAGFLSA